MHDDVIELEAPARAAHLAGFKEVRVNPGHVIELIDEIRRLRDRLGEYECFDCEDSLDFCNCNEDE